MGVAMVAVGAYYYVEKGDFLNLLPKYEDVNITGVMIAAGIIVFVVSFIGFCGVWMESQCMLIMVKINKIKTKIKGASWGLMEVVLKFHKLIKITRHLFFFQQTNFLLPADFFS